MFKNKSIKLKNRILEEANSLKLDAREKTSMSPRFLVALQMIIDDLEGAEFVKDKEKKVTLKVLQSNFDDVVSAYNSEDETSAIKSCDLFRSNLKKITKTVSDNPEELEAIVMQHLQEVLDIYSKELARLNKEKEDCEGQLIEDRTNAAIATKYQTICKAISDTADKIKSVKTQLDLHNSWLSPEDKSANIAGSEKKENFFKDPEMRMNGYKLVGLHYKYKELDECQERDNLVSDVKELLEKRGSTSKAERTILDRDINTKNKRVSELDKSINEYHRARRLVESVPYAVRKNSTSKDVQTSDNYRPINGVRTQLYFLTGFDVPTSVSSNSPDDLFYDRLCKIAEELKDRVESGKVDSDDLSFVNKMVYAILPIDEEGDVTLSSSESHDEYEIDETELERLKKKYGI